MEAKNYTDCQTTPTSIRHFIYLCKADSENKSVDKERSQNTPHTTKTHPTNKMNTLDLVLFLPIVIGFIFGVFKGLIKELTSLAAIVLGIYGAKYLGAIVANILITSFGFTPLVAQPLAYLVLFVVIAIALLMVAKMLDKFFSAIALGGANKLMGGVFGALKYALIISVLLNVFEALDSRFKLMDAETKQKSIGYIPLLKLGPTMWDEAKKQH